ncbi:MAG: hypothetical protein VX583_05700 [Bdellovibrionota bacterium]
MAKQSLGKSKTSYQSFVGIALSGAKNDRTTFCELQYFPKYDQIALSSVVEGIGPSKSKLGDSILVEKINALKSVKKLAVNSSIQLPPCFRCRLSCPGIESCRVEEVKWLHAEFQKEAKKNKKAKMPLPYTDRPVEYYINTHFEKNIETQYSLSANAAPLTARSFFLNKHFKEKLIEVLPSLSVWRIGNYLKVQKSYLKYYKNSEDCEVIRLFFLDQVKEKIPLFLYNQDKQKLVSNPQAFDAFICALTAFYEHKRMTEDKPKNFPKKASWVAIPKEDLSKAFQK